MITRCAIDYLIYLSPFHVEIPLSDVKERRCLKTSGETWRAKARATRLRAPVASRGICMDRSMGWRLLTLLVATPLNDSSMSTATINSSFFPHVPPCRCFIGPDQVSRHYLRAHYLTVQHTPLCNTTAMSTLYCLPYHHWCASAGWQNGRRGGGRERGINLQLCAR